MAENVRTWITARLEVDGTLADGGGDNSTIVIDVHAEKIFGGRPATVHVPVPQETAEKVSHALISALRQVEPDALERVDEAALLHRIHARDHGEDWKADLEYAPQGTEVEVDDQVYSSPEIMSLPSHMRQAALTMAPQDRAELVEKHGLKGDR